MFDRPGESILNRTVVVAFDSDCAVVKVRVKVSCITSVDGIILWLLMIGQLRRDVIGRLSVKP